MMLVMLLLACAEDPAKAVPTYDGTYSLGGGAALTVSADGRLVLEVDGDETFATAAPVASRTVDETTEMALGMWQHTRDSAETVLYDGVLDAVPDGSGVVLTLGSEDGPTAALSVAQVGDRVAFELSVDAEADALVVPVRCDADGSFHGWGAQYHSTDQRGERFRLFVSEQGIGRDPEGLWSLDGNTHTSYFPMPWYVDGRGFGVLFDTDHRTNVDLCDSDVNIAEVEVMAGESLRWSVMVGPTVPDVIRQLGDHIGRPKAPPSWAYGTWMCMQGGEARVREQLQTIETAGIPATVLWVQDWSGRRENVGGGYGVQYRWVADEAELYPDIAAFFAELKGRGYRVVGYMNPFVDPVLDHWDDMEAGGMLPLHPETGEVYTFLGPRGNMTTADLRSEAGRAYIKAHLSAAVSEVGLDGWMADFAEWLPTDAVLADGSDARAAHNTYPEEWQRLTREVMDELRPDGDWLMFARSGWTGVHEVAMIHWMGDQEADFLPTDGLPTVVPAMLNMGLSGQPFVTHDIAGFSGGPSTEELYKRWTELGAFTPYMRTHDGNERDENWRWDSDEDTLAFFGRFARIHQALQPELEALAAEAATTGMPIVRHLMLEYPGDAETWDISDQYLLGPDLLVAPITEEGSTRRDVYLPEGDWFNVWTGQESEGPGWVAVSSPIGQPPVFSRGSDRTDLRFIE